MDRTFFQTEPLPSFPLPLLDKVIKFGGLGMTTWQDEFVRLSELHRHEVERWLEGVRNADQVIDAGEAQRALLRQWMSAGEPGRIQQKPD